MPIVHTFAWILLWYLACGLLIFGVKTFYDLVNKPHVRYSDGDVTTEAGYEEDSMGNDLPLSVDDECVDPDTPHVQPVGKST